MIGFDFDENGICILFSFSKFCADILLLDNKKIIVIVIVNDNDKLIKLYLEKK